MADFPRYPEQFEPYTVYEPLTEWAHRTNTGRVVYDRKKSPFTWCDVRRVIKSVVTDPDRGFSVKQNVCFLDALSWMAAEIVTSIGIGTEILEVEEDTVITAFDLETMLQTAVSIALGDLDDEDDIV